MQDTTMQDAAQENENRPLRISAARKREILWAVAWRGMLYSIAALIIAACCGYLFSFAAWQFFLNEGMKLAPDATAILILWLALPSLCVGWVLAVNHVLHLRFSHFRISLSTEPPRRSKWQLFKQK